MRKEDTQNILSNHNKIKKELEFLHSKIEELNQNKERFLQVNLPSNGIFYQKSLKIRYLNYFDELLLTNLDIEQDEKIMQVLKNVILDKKFNIEKLITADVIGIEMVLRAIAYGDLLEGIKINCPHCASEEIVDIRISSFKTKDIITYPDKNREYDIHLRDNTDIKLRIPTYLEEKSFTREKKGSANSLFNIISCINGNRDKKYILNFVNSLLIRDVREIKDFILNTFPGIDGTYIFNCPHCGKESKHMFNFDDKFLNLPESYINILRDSCFLICYYGQGYDISTVHNMSVAERNWTLDRISTEIEKSRKAEKKALKK